MDGGMDGHPTLVPVLATVWRGWTDLVSGFDEDSFSAPTRAEGWTVRDLLLHVLLDAQRALMAFAETSDEAPTADRVSYWSGQRPDPVGAQRHAAFVRRAAAAYDGAAGLVAQWTDTARAASRAAEAADHRARVHTQGLVLAVPDFVSTLVVEAAVHWLDLTVALEVPGLPETVPPEPALRETVEVTTALLGRPFPAGWGEVGGVLRATGRVPLTEEDRAALGPAADAVPVLR
ncbi:mycothiol maleylpyruvate isomerase-like protein [Phycicoccus sp. SLBN-51]|nr:mycothiol maleylpyruvate isomerase-like protein [Phycicoccus sp. SLBN-51]